MQPLATTPDLTPANLKELNHYWRLLAAVTNEIDLALTMGDRTPEQRLAKIKELVVFARAHMSWRVPPSVVAEDLAKPERQAEQAAVAAALQEREDRREAGEPTYHYRVNEQGVMEGPFLDDPEDGPLTEEEVERMLREGWGA